MVFLNRIRLQEHVKRELHEVMYNLIFDPSFKGAVHLNSISKISYAFWTRGEILKRIIKEPFITESCGMAMLHNNKLFDAFDLKTQQLVAAGIIDYHANVFENRFNPNFYKKPKLLTRQYLETVYIKSFPEGPQILTWEHLEAGFIVWLCCLLFALIAFIFEWIIRLKNFLLIKYILFSFYETKRLEPRYKAVVNVRPLLFEIVIDKKKEQWLTHEIQSNEVKPDLSGEFKSTSEESQAFMFEETTDELK